MIFSVGMMSYMQNFKKILSDMNDILPDKGRIFFAEYVDFFWVIPNAAILSADEKIKKSFQRIGILSSCSKEESLVLELYLYLWY